jgi:hypothetical protein
MDRELISGGWDRTTDTRLMKTRVSRFAVLAESKEMARRCNTNAYKKRIYVR